MSFKCGISGEWIEGHAKRGPPKDDERGPSTGRADFSSRKLKLKASMHTGFWLRQEWLKSYQQAYEKDILAG
jgi:hypothetical protein